MVQYYKSEKLKKQYRKLFARTKPVLKNKKIVSKTSYDVIKIILFPKLTIFNVPKTKLLYIIVTLLPQSN